MAGMTEGVNEEPGDEENFSVDRVRNSLLMMAFGLYLLLTGDYYLNLIVKTVFPFLTDHLDNVTKNLTLYMAAEMPLVLLALSRYWGTPMFGNFTSALGLLFFILPMLVSAAPFQDVPTFRAYNCENPLSVRALKLHSECSSQINQTTKTKEI